MAPLGDPDMGLGMGHWMFMGRGFVGLRSGRLDATVAAGLGGGLPGGHDHAGAWPPLAPMNVAEARGAAQVHVALGRGIGAGAAQSGAYTLGDGEALGRVSALLTAALLPVQLSVQLSRGLGGHPLALGGWMQLGVDL
jgi:hypothetical protein